MCKLCSSRDEARRDEAYRTSAPSVFDHTYRVSGMVRATRARCYESDTSEDSRPRKRRRVGPPPHFEAAAAQRQPPTPRNSASLGPRSASPHLPRDHDEHSDAQPDMSQRRRRRRLRMRTRRARRRTDENTMTNNNMDQEQEKPDQADKLDPWSEQWPFNSHYTSSFSISNSIKPPPSALTPPPSARSSPAPIDATDFEDQLDIAYIKSIVREGARRDKYGAAVADAWKRGSTPEEARSTWRSVKARHEAELNEISDSD